MLEVAKAEDYRVYMTVASMYESGLGTSVDKGQALYWYEQGATTGFAEAMYHCVLLYGNDFDKANYWYEKLKKHPQGGDYAKRLQEAGKVPSKKDKVRENEGKQQNDAVNQTNRQNTAVSKGEVKQQTSEQTSVNEGKRYFDLAATCIRKEPKNWEKAKEYCQKALELDYEPAKKLSEVMKKAERFFEAAFKAYQNEQYDTALKSFTTLADKGHPDALYNLGMMYFGGKGCEKDYSKAVHYYEQAAGQGHAAACYSLGLMYYGGFGVEKNLCKALQLIEQAADTGIVSAQKTCGDMYMKGVGTKVDLDKARKWFTLASEQGDEEAKQYLQAMEIPDGYLLIAANYAEQGDDEHYNELVAVAASQGSKLAQNKLGHRYIVGRDVEIDLDMARKWLKLAADQGDEESQSSLRCLNDPLLLYMLALKMKEDGDTMRYLKYMEGAANIGSSIAQATLGSMYLLGKDVPVDVDQGRKWYKKAVDGGHKEANEVYDAIKDARGLFLMARTMYSKKEYAIAKAFASKAYEDGFITAATLIGTLYYYGHGVSKDLSLAKKWIEIGAKAGDNEAKYMLRNYSF